MRYARQAEAFRASSSSPSTTFLISPEPLKGLVKHFCRNFTAAAWVNARTGPGPSKPSVTAGQKEKKIPSIWRTYLGSRAHSPWLGLMEKQISIITPVAARSPKPLPRFPTSWLYIFWIFISYLERASCYAAMYSKKSV